MSLERVFNALLSLGLSETDARVYIFLALNGPKDAKILIEKLQISQQQILQSLRNLQNKEIILTDNKNRKIFSALPFEKALKYTVDWYINNERWWKSLATKVVLHPTPWKIKNPK